MEPQPGELLPALPEVMSPNSHPNKPITMNREKCRIKSRGDSQNIQQSECMCTGSSEQVSAVMPSRGLGAFHSPYMPCLLDCGETLISWWEACRGLGQGLHSDWHGYLSLF